MKKAKKLLSIFLSICMLLSITAGLDFPSYAEELESSGKCGDNVYWTFNSSTGELVISGTGDMEDYSYDSTPFYSQIGLKSVVINDGVTSIGHYAFYNCSSLTSIAIPDSVTDIGDSAFQGCSSLKSITIPDSVTSIGYDAFNGTALYNNDSNWINNVLYIGNHLIKAKNSILGSYEIKKGTIVIGDYAFSRCEGLTGITIPDSVTEIGERVFSRCTGLLSTEIPNSVTGIGEAAFFKCTGLKSVSLPNGITEIGTWMFDDCISLETVVIPDSVTSIGEYAFYNCNKLNPVYYLGTSTQWENIYVKKGNESLIHAGVQYNCPVEHPLQGHQWIELNRIKNPTCAEKGLATYKCKICEKIEDLPINTLPHSPAKAVEENRKESTCISLGSFEMVVYCTKCNAEISRTKKIIDKQNHIPATEVKEIKVEPTCIKIGSYDSVVYCSVCRTELSRTPNTIEIQSHTPAKAVEENRVDSTCTKAGSYDMVSYCSVCNVEMSRTHKQLSFAAHKPSDAVRENVVEPTCTANGSYDSVVYCSICKYEISREHKVLEIHHNYVPIITAPTCSTRGYTTYECSICKNSYISDYTDVVSNNHSYKKSKTVNWTYTERGYSEFVCEFCGDNYIDNYTQSPYGITTQYGDCSADGSNVMWYYFPDEMLLIISGKGKMANFSNSQAPWKSLTIEKAIVEDGVTNIGNYSFYYANEMNSLTISNSVKTIGDFSFMGCHSLTNINIPNSVTSIGKHAFSSCEKLNSAKIGTELVSIGEAAFEGCRELVNIAFPNKIKKIENNAFNECASLTSVSIPNSVTEMGQNAFSGCASLKKVELGNGLKSISIAAFSNCENIQTVALPNALTSINDYAFYKCESLNSINIPDGITKIGDYAFGNCKSIQNLKLRDSLKIIGNSAFSECVSLNNVALPNNLTSIGRFAFTNCKSISKIKIPDSVKELGQSAFSNCKNAQTIVIGSGLTEILTGTFSGCESLNILIIPPTINYVGNAFSGCKSLRELTVPVTLKEFNNNTEFEQLETLSITMGIVNEKNTGVMDKESNWSNCRNVSEIKLANGIDNIVDSAFAGFDNIKSVTIPKTVTYVGEKAFDKCQRLNAVTFLSPSTNIDTNAIPYYVTIYGYDGSVAESYASINKNAFKSLGKYKCEKCQYNVSVELATLNKNGKMVKACPVCKNTVQATVYRPKAITLSTTKYTYDGKVKKPTVKVVDANGKTIAASNYTVTYSSGLKNVGKYTVKIAFKGNYSGTVSKTFVINPKNTSISKLTATKGGFKATIKKYTTQTTGYQIRYSTKSNMSGVKTVTITKNTTTSKSVAGLSKGKKYYVQIRTFKTVNETKYYSAWSGSKTVTTKK